MDHTLRRTTLDKQGGLKQAMFSVFICETIYLLPNLKSFVCCVTSSGQLPIAHSAHHMYYYLANIFKINSLFHMDKF